MPAARKGKKGSGQGVKRRATPVVIGARSIERDTAPLFMHGRSQAVRLPLAYRMPGDRVRIKRVPGGLLLEPIEVDLDALFAEIDARGGGDFMKEGRDQPPMPDDDDIFK